MIHFTAHDAHIPEDSLDVRESNSPTSTTLLSIGTQRSSASLFLDRADTARLAKCLTELATAPETVEPCELQPGDKYQVHPAQNYRRDKPPITRVHIGYDPATQTLFYRGTEDPKRLRLTIMATAYRWVRA